MTSCNILPTIDDFVSSPWKKVVTAQNIRSCQKYSSAFENCVNDIEYKQHKEVFRILSAICTMAIPLENIAIHYKDLSQRESWGNSVPQNVTDEITNILWEFLHTVDDAELKARLADLVWRHKGAHKREAATIAVNSLLESSLRLRPQDKYMARTRLRRAVDLAYELGKGGKSEQENALAAVRDWLRSTPHEEADGAESYILEILLKHGAHEEYGEWAEYCYCVSEKKHTQKKYHMQRCFIDLQLKFDKADSNLEQNFKSKIDYVQSFIDEANEKNNSAMRKCAFLRNALEACRRLGVEKEFPELHSDLLDNQKNIPDEMVTHLIPLPDLTGLAGFARKSVSGKDLDLALKSFSSGLCIPSRKVLERTAHEEFTNNPLSHLFPCYIFNNSGKIVDKAINDEQHIMNGIMRHLIILCTIYSAGYIQPALETLRNEHEFTEDVILPFVKGHHLVPSGRERFYSRGLLAGYLGDYVTACSFLIPQLEASIRYLLEQCGEITSSYDSSGIQNEKSLNYLFDCRKTKDIFGEDLIFLFKSILIDDFGPNLRNKFAHGLMLYDEFQGAECQFFWWLMQRIIILGI